MALPRDRWHKSTYSQEGGSSCVEAADVADAVLVRDTKQKGRGPILNIRRAAWTTFIADCKTGSYDLLA